jgi:hypothetical protein
VGGSSADVALFERFAAALGVLLGQVPLPGPQLHHREVTQTLRAHPVVSSLARPGVLAGMAGDGALDVVDALEPDERDRVRVNGGSGPGFERQAPLEQVAACASSEKHPGQEAVDEDGREQFAARDPR